MQLLNMALDSCHEPRSENHHRHEHAPVTMREVAQCVTSPAVVRAIIAELEARRSK